MDETQSALASKRYRQPRFGNRVHRRADERNVEPNFASQIGRRVDLGGQDRTEGGNQENVVEGEGFRDGTVDHTS